MSGVNGAGAYLLDSRHPAADEHHQALADLFDAGSLRRTRALAGDRWPLRRVLDVGAGRGGFAHLLASGAADAHVVALDVEPPASRVPGVVPLRHDLTSHEPLPEGPYEFVHARLVLAHLPEREQILARMVQAVAPAGLMLIEEWVPVREHVVVAAPSPQDADLYQRYVVAAGKAFTGAGNDPTWGRRVHRCLLGHGLVDVRTEISADYWTGGDPGCRLLAATVPQLAHRLMDIGLTGREIARVRELLHDPGLVVHPHLLYSTSGRKPPAVQSL